MYNLMLRYSRRLQRKKDIVLPLRNLKFNGQVMKVKYFNNNRNGQTSPSSWNGLTTTALPSSLSSTSTPEKHHVHQAKRSTQEVDSSPRYLLCHCKIPTCFL